MIIDARNKLKPEDISTFLSQVTGEIVVNHVSNGVNNIIATVDAKHFVDCFLTLSFLTDDVEIIFANEDTQLLVTGMDVNWWKQNARRYNKLYKAAEVSKENVEENKYSVAAATLMNGRLSQIKHIYANKSDVIKFMNDEINTRMIDSFLKAKIVFNLAYIEGEPLNVVEWLTLEELSEMGAIKLS